MSAVISLVYIAPFVVVTLWYLRARQRAEAQSARVRAETQRAGLFEPASLHPAIDASRCVGCGACVRACPEQPEHHVLGLIDRKAHLVSPTDCIGHGACMAACPVGAISLVFGTATRGIDIPLLSPQFETNIPGVYIAGELGGMGLIRNALVQGRQAIEAIAARRTRGKEELDVIIVGAGPAGFAASLTAMSLGLRFVTIEQESLGGCVFQYPRRKLVMTAPAELPLVGRVKLERTSKEELLQFWKDVEARTGVRIQYRERVEAVAGLGAGLVVKTTKREYRANAVLLAIGRRGTPRKLGVEGEELAKVVYRLIDPEQYEGQRVLVVGGGDSALEAAASIAELGSAQVALSYRGDVFNRAKASNRERVGRARMAGSLRVILGSTVRRIGAEDVVLDQSGQSLRLENDAVIVSAGGVLPTQFLRSIGVQVKTHFGTA
jgi:thioredoxin reductase/ferredoxin